MTDNEKFKGINREYKDRLFKLIFGNPRHKDWTLILLNAVSGTNYTDSDAVEFTTIEDAVYLGMKNDVSFLFNGVMSFYEQQSSPDKTLPVRFLSYSGMIYSKHIERTWKNEQRFPKEFPIPICVCFYNGTSKQPDRQELKLSDLFIKSPVPLKIQPSIEVTVTVFNVNSGRNKELLASCKPLADYSWFVGRVRFNQTKTETIGEAIDLTLKEMSDDSILKPFLLENQAEVKNMWITEYNEEMSHAMFRQQGYDEGYGEGREEGREEGRKEGVAIGEARGEARGVAIGEARGEARGEERGLVRGIAKLVKNGVVSLAQAAEQLEMTEDEFVEKAAELGFDLC